MTVISILYLIGCLELNFGTLSMPEEGFVPLIFGSLFFGGCCCLSAEALIKIRKESNSSPKNGKIEVLSIIPLIGTLIGAVILLPILGFTLSTFGLVVISAKIMRVKWLTAFILATGVTLISYLLFVFWLEIPFPPFVVL